MFIRLDRNEMPRPPPKEIIDVMKLSLDKIHRYTPQYEVDILINLLSDYTKAPQDSIILSSGSDILIKEFIYLFSRGRQIVIADPTFILISNTAPKTSSPILKVRLKEPEFKFYLESIIDEIKKPTLMILDNPNNPTGSLILNEKDVKMILENENIIFLIDEAYFEFSNITYSHMIKDYPNLAIVRTLSKSFGLAGSGIGYIIAGEIIQQRFLGLNIMLPYPSVIAGINALKNKNYMIKYIKEVTLEKKRIIDLVLNLGFKVYPSFTNFLLIKTNIQKIAKKLRDQNILVLDLSNQLGSEYIRVTLGTKKENDFFLQALKKIIV